MLVIQNIQQAQRYLYNKLEKSGASFTLCRKPFDNVRTKALFGSQRLYLYYNTPDHSTHTIHTDYRYKRKAVHA